MSQKITMVNDKIYGPSVGIYVRSMAECMGRDAKLCTLIYDKKNKKKELDGEKEYGIYPPGTSGWFLNTTFQDFAFRKFKRILVRESNNLIHYTSQQVKPFRIGHSTVTVHDLVPILFPEQTNRSIVRLTKNNIKFYSKLPVTAAVSEFTKRTMEEQGFEGEIYVVPNTISKTFQPLGTDKQVLRRKLGLPIEKKLILSVSTDVPRKNLNIVKETLNRLGDDYKLVRVGSPVGDSINFHNITEKKLNEVYNACDIFFLPSSYEGFGLPVLEAMSSGVPVVASDIQVFREITNGSALLCDPDPVICSESIIRAIDVADKLVHKGLDRAKAFDYENFCRQLTKFYEAVFQTYGLN